MVNHVELAMVEVAGMEEMVVTASANVKTGATMIPIVLSIMPLKSPLSPSPKNVNVIAAHMSGKSDKDNDAKPAANGKMASNDHTPALTKNPKRRRNDARLCLMGATHPRVVFVLLSLLSLLIVPLILRIKLNLTHMLTLV